LDYLEENFILTDLIEFEKRIRQLKEIRKQKQQNVKTVIQYSDIKQQLVTDLKHWIELGADNQ
jgi:hypothetical protein